MNEKTFLRQLKQEAKKQAPLESAHLFSPTFRRFTAWIWQHSWQVWLFFALLAAVIFESQWGRCG